MLGDVGSAEARYVFVPVPAHSLNSIDRMFEVDRFSAPGGGGGEGGGSSDARGGGSGVTQQSLLKYYRHHVAVHVSLCSVFFAYRTFRSSVCTYSCSQGNNDVTTNAQYAE